MANPPYKPSTLTVPLGPKRASILHWLFTSTVSGWTAQDKAIVTADSDEMLIALYSSWYDAETKGGPGLTKISGPSNLPGDPSNNLLGQGTGAVIGAVNNIGDFLNLITSGAFWLRALEIIAGLLLVGIGVSKLSSGAGNTLRSIPVYGKAIPS